MIIWWIIVSFMWILKITVAHNRESVWFKTSKEAAVTKAILWPLISLGLILIWNVWARHWIGWPAITTVKEFIIVGLIF